jgi:hypothetical protein
MFITMEWTIPAQKVDVSHVHIGSPTKSLKPMSPISYTEGDVRFPSLTVLFPHLTVKSYDAENGRLSLSLNGTTSLLSKMQALQNMFVSSMINGQREWFPGERGRGGDEIAGSFQPLISHSCIHLYCPLSTTGSPNEIHVFSGGKWSCGIISPSMFAAGKQIRIAVRFQGISFHQHPVTKMWTGKSRIQHRILAVYSE